MSVTDQQQNGVTLTTNIGPNTILWVRLDHHDWTDTGRSLQIIVFLLEICWMLANNSCKSSQVLLETSRSFLSPEWYLWYRLPRDYDETSSVTIPTIQSQHSIFLSLIARQSVQMASLFQVILCILIMVGCCFSIPVRSCCSRCSGCSIWSLIHKCVKKTEIWYHLADIDQHFRYKF